MTQGVLAGAVVVVESLPAMTSSRDRDRATTPVAILRETTRGTEKSTDRGPGITLVEISHGTTRGGDKGLETIPVETSRGKIIHQGAEAGRSRERGITPVETYISRPRVHTAAIKVVVAVRALGKRGETDWGASMGSIARSTNV